MKYGRTLLMTPSGESVMEYRDALQNTYDIFQARVWDEHRRVLEERDYYKWWARILAVATCINGVIALWLMFIH
jgi:hypothetical protein